MSEAFRIMAQGVGPDGFQLADERESLLWGFVNMLDSQTNRLDRQADKLLPELRDLQRAQDGTEIKSRELELVTDRAQNLTARRDAFEMLRDEAAQAYRSETGNVWRPRRGSHTSQTGKLTSAAVDARDYMRARKDRETTAHLPVGTLIAITGGKDACVRLSVVAGRVASRPGYPLKSPVAALPPITAPIPRASAPFGRCALRLPAGSLRSPALHSVRRR